MLTGIQCPHHRPIYWPLFLYSSPIQKEANIFGLISPQSEVIVTQCIVVVAKYAQREDRNIFKDILPLQI